MQTGVQESIVIPPPAAPASGATITLFDSSTAFGAKMLRVLGADMVDVSWLRLSHISGTNGFVAKASTDGGANWRTLSYPDGTGTATMPVTVAALSASTNNLYSFVITPFQDFQLVYTNSANALSAWELMITVHCNAKAVQK